MAHAQRCQLLRFGVFLDIRMHYCFNESIVAKGFHFFVFTGLANLADISTWSFEWHVLCPVCRVGYRR